jgi:hypothetical protein
LRRQPKITKRLGIILLIFSLGAGVLLPAAMPAMADISTPVTITLVSGNTTQTAGYTYNNPLYDADTFVSGSNTDTAGFTAINPSAAPLVASSYNGTWSPAQVVNSNAGPWTNIGGAKWVSTTSANSGVENPNEGDAWRLFRATFNVTNISSITETTIQIAADNAYEFYFNGVKIDSTENSVPAATVYGTSPEPGGSMTPFEQTITYSIFPDPGINTLLFVVRNWGNSGGENPTGLVYKVTVRRQIIQQQLNPAVYSGAGSWTTASIVTVQPSSWVQPAGGAKWVSTTADYSGSDNDSKGDAWRLFKDEFNIPAGAAIDSASIQIAAADNAYECYLNGTKIYSTDNLNPECTVYGDSPEPGGSMIPFEQVATYALTPHSGTNTLMFVVRNWDNGGSSNPTGLLYKAGITYETPTSSGSHSINAGGDSGGTILPSGYVSVTNAGSQTFNIEASSGYNITNVVVDGISQGAISTYTFTNVTADHTIYATFYTTAVANSTGNVNIPAGQTNYVINAPSAQAKVTVNTNTLPVNIDVINYSGNPHPEASLPANSLPLYNDIIVSNTNAVTWPLYVQISYSDADVSRIIESSLKMYYFQGTSWHVCSNTGVDTVNNVVWAYMTEAETSGSPLTVGGDPMSSPVVTVGGNVYQVNKMLVLAPYFILMFIIMLVVSGGCLFFRRFSKSLIGINKH